MSTGFKNQLLVSKMTASLTKKHQRHLFMARTDYKRASDSLPCAWIVTVWRCTEYVQL